MYSASFLPSAFSEENNHTQKKKKKKKKKNAFFFLSFFLSSRNTKQSLNPLAPTPNRERETDRQTDRERDRERGDSRETVERERGGGAGEGNSRLVTVERERGRRTASQFYSHILLENAYKILFEDKFPQASTRSIGHFKTLWHILDVKVSLFLTRSS